MGKSMFTSEQVDWIKAQLAVLPAWKVLPLINEKYNMNWTEAKFKCWRSNHKIYGHRENPNKGTCEIFTPEQEAFIQKHANDWEAPHIADELNKMYGTNFSALQVKSYKRRKHCTSDHLTGAWNEYRQHPYKGKKWCIKNSEATRFKKGQQSVNRAEDKTIVIRNHNRRNYKVKFIKINGKWQLLHRYIWEQAHGPLKTTDRIKFLDNNPLNCSLENLIVIDFRTQGKCCGKKLWSENPDITKAGILLSQLEIALEDIGAN